MCLDACHHHRLAADVVEALRAKVPKLARTCTDVPMAVAVLHGTILKGSHVLELRAGMVGRSA